MRAFLNAILAFIGAESLTDEEFEYCDEQLSSSAYDVATYTALDSVLADRESVSSNRDRLRYYFLARGVAVGELDQGKSNILIGAPL